MIIIALIGSPAFLSVLFGNRSVRQDYYKFDQYRIQVYLKLVNIPGLSNVIFPLILISRLRNSEEP